MTYASRILAGALLCNCIPHLIAGLQGTAFPTPFAKPSGIGDSPSIVNFAWGSANLLAGLLVTAKRPQPAGEVASIFAFALGFVATGTFLSLKFGKLR